MLLNRHKLSVLGVENVKSERDRVASDFTDAPLSVRSFLTNFGLVSEIAFIRGIDVSMWQGNGGDFKVLVNSGWPVVVIKASEALSKDPKFDILVQKAIDAGALIMVYHFFRSNVDGEAQAKFCLDVINNSPLKDYQNKTVVWCDIETADGVSNSLRISRVKKFLDTIVAGGHEAGMYCSPYLWSNLMSPTPSWTNNYWLWVAHWTGSTTFALPNGWSLSRTIFWQYGIWNDYPWCPPVPGWNPDVDVDKALFSTRELMEASLGIIYLGQEPSTVPGLNELEVIVPAEVYTEPNRNSTLVKVLPVGARFVPTQVEIKSVNNVWYRHVDGWTRMGDYEIKFEVIETQYLNEVK